MILMSQFNVSPSWTYWEGTTLGPMDRMLITLEANSIMLSTIVSAYTNGHKYNLDSISRPQVTMWSINQPNQPKGRLRKPSFNELFIKAWETTIDGSPMYIMAQKLRFVKMAMKPCTVIEGNSIAISRNLVEELHLTKMMLQVNLSNEELHLKHGMLVANLVEAHTCKMHDLRQKVHTVWLLEGDQDRKFFG